MKKVFADVFFYIALLNRGDAAHRRSLELLKQGAMEVFTTTAVLLEVADAMAAPAMRTDCAAFLEELSGWTKVRSLDEALLQRGLSLYGSRKDKAWSLTECISFVVMGDEGLTDALTGDRHFEQAGFTALLV